MFLPTTKSELKNLNWEKCDIILVTGDAYIDSPFIGVSIIGKVLYSAGYKVGIIGQPNINNNDITRLGEPTLFWGVTSGCIDSMIANYTSLQKKRKSDDYTPGGINNKRPDRAVIVYSNLIRKYFKKTVPIILGGIEASLRRIPHYDYISNTIRRPILFDAKADFLVYGMGEKTILEVANNLKKNISLKNIRGLCYIENNISDLNNNENNIEYNRNNHSMKLPVLNEINNENNNEHNRNNHTMKSPVLNEIKNENNIEHNRNNHYIILPSFNEIKNEKELFIKMYNTFYSNNLSSNPKILYQKIDTRYLVQTPRQKELTSKELDEIYEQDFERDSHPHYKKQGKIKAIDTIKFSVTSHRGCFGECNFCAIALHQGKKIISRSVNSLKKEIIRITKNKSFKGYITDVGGPTANMYKMKCSKNYLCNNKRCLYPTKCKNLIVDHSLLNNMLNELKNIKNIKKIFVASGIRFDLIALDKNNGDKYLKNIINNHVSGQLKIAPESVNPYILNLMGKPCLKEDLEHFIKKFYSMNNNFKLKQFLTYYLMAMHPGSNLKDYLNLINYFINTHKTKPKQVQVFYPSPSTFSTLMYYTEKNPFTKEKIFVEKNLKNKKIR